MKQPILCLLLLLFTLPAAAHEEFWWHAYAYDADRMDTLDIERVDSLLRVTPKGEQWLHTKVDQVHWYYHQNLPDVAANEITNTLRLVVSGQPYTSTPAYWYYGFLNLFVEKTTNRLEFTQALKQIIKRNAVPVPGDECLPCIGVEFNYLKLMAKTGRFVTDTQYKTIVELFNEAYRVDYSEILGILAGYLVYASNNQISDRIADMVLDIPTLLHELPPRPKARVLLNMAPLIESVGADSTVSFWRDYLNLGSSKNLFAWFRGNIELGITYEELGEWDSAMQCYQKALHYARRSHDFEAEVHALNLLERMHKRYLKEALPDSLLARKVYLQQLQETSSNQLQVSLNDILIRDLDASNRRLANQNQIIILLLAGVGVLVVGLSLLLGRLFKQRRALEQANADKTMLYGMIAHDLRSPLSAFKSVLQKDITPLEKEQQLDRVVNRLQWLLDDLLKWTYTQQQQLAVHLESFDAIELLEENLEYFQHLLYDKNIQLSITLPDELPTVADRDMVSTLLRNVLQNAIKHNITNGTIQIVGSLEDDGPLLTITNTFVDNNPSKHPSLGQQLIKTFAKINNIQLATQRIGEHYSIKLQFPAPMD